MTESYERWLQRTYSGSSVKMKMKESKHKTVPHISARSKLAGTESVL